MSQELGLIVMATEAAKQESNYREAFHFRQPECKAPALAGTFARSAYDRFKELGFPSVKEEEWKYTNVAPLTKLSFESGKAASATTVTAAEVSSTVTLKPETASLYS